jgi:hypothetical protein
LDLSHILVFGLWGRLDKEFSVVREAEEKNREEDDAEGSEEESSADEEMEEVQDPAMNRTSPVDSLFSMLILRSTINGNTTRRNTRRTIKDIGSDRSG